jgi:hypothetical protein
MSGIAPAPVFGSFGGDSNKESASLELGRGKNADDDSSLNANAAPFEPPTVFGVASALSGSTASVGKFGASSSSSTSTNTSLGAASSAIPTQGFLSETPAGEDNPFLQNVQGSSSILSGASFTFSGGPNSIDSFSSSTTPSISFGGGLQSAPLAFGGGSGGMMFGSGPSGTFSGFGVPAATDSPNVDVETKKVGGAGGNSNDGDANDDK